MSKKESNLSIVLSNNAVPILFIFISVIGIYFAGFSPQYLIQEMTTRLSSNLFLVLALLIPIVAGMGLNFGIVLGAMAGQIGLIMITEWGVAGIPGMLLAMIVATPIAVLLGYFCGGVLNRAKGKEMITSYVLGFFMNGVYQVFVLYIMGSLIPITNKMILLPRGYGLRNAIDLIGIRRVLDDFIPINIGGISIPLSTFLVIIGLCLVIVWFRKTKLGQDMRAVGQDMEVARAAGIPVERTRNLSIIISTVFASYGQILFLQNIGTMNTYSSHEQIGMFSIAALLVGGATVTKATIPNAFVGVILFHLMFVVSPMAGKNIIGSAQLGEYFRVFVSYGIIAIALALHAWKRQKEKERYRMQMIEQQSNE